MVVGYYNWWKNLNKSLMAGSTETKPNYCERGDMMSVCTVPKHKKTDPKIIFEKCLYFQPRGNSTSACLFYRNGKLWNHHCDCVEAQYGK
jgi:hypothetical protein